MDICQMCLYYIHSDLFLVTEKKAMYVSTLFVIFLF